MSFSVLRRLLLVLCASAFTTPFAWGNSDPCEIKSAFSLNADGILTLEEPLVINSNGILTFHDPQGPSRRPIKLNAFKNIRSWRHLLGPSKIYTVNFSKDGSRIYIYSDNKEKTYPRVSIWNAQNAKLLQVIDPGKSKLSLNPAYPSGPALSATLSPDEHVLILEQRARLAFFNLQTGQAFSSYEVGSDTESKTNSSRLKILTFSLNNRLVLATDTIASPTAIPGRNFHARFIRMSDGGSDLTPLLLNWSPDFAELSPQEDFVVLKSAGGEAQVWSMRALRNGVYAADGPAFRMPDGSGIASIHFDKSRDSLLLQGTHSDAIVEIPLRQVAPHFAFDLAIPEKFSAMTKENPEDDSFQKLVPVLIQLKNEMPNNIEEELRNAFAQLPSTGFIFHMLERRHQSIFALINIRAFYVLIDKEKFPYIKKMMLSDIDEGSF